jgi:pimeloyl-ACP methyl ester carboxylesterase
MPGDVGAPIGGARIAGWYIPAANGSGPTAPTVVIVHGWDANKSEALRYSVPLHDRFNVVVMDQRAGGRTSGAESTFGVREQLDIRAMIDWLERTKQPSHVAVMGNSMGGGSAAAAAAADPRIEALVLDSTHAYVSGILERHLEVDAGHPALPGTPAIIAGMWLRTGLDVTAADPIRAIPTSGSARCCCSTAARTSTTFRRGAWTSTTGRRSTRACRWNGTCAPQRRTARSSTPARPSGASGS